MKPKGRSKMVWVLVALSPIPIVLMESGLVSAHRIGLPVVIFTCLYFNAAPSLIGAFKLISARKIDLAGSIFLSLLLAAGFYVINLVGGIAGCSMITSEDIFKGR